MRSPWEPSSVYYLVKRLVDVVGAVLLMVLLAPLLPVIVIGILLESGRPVFFSQPRIRARRMDTEGGVVWRLEQFTFYKFRTMRAGSVSDSHEAYMAAYIAGDEDTLARLRPNMSNDTVGTYKLLEDPRVTRFGRVLRAASIDELPQLWNVLKGDMSLVGPRPPIPYEVSLYRPRDMARFACAPGITGLWQVSGRSDLSFESMIGLDLQYIERRSIRFDLHILLRTIPAVLTGKGAG